ncbi:MFS transporter [Candidatus Parcubacteria bacterium]|nr:MFS transporter [Candidatus Parcubacteria bacterium]
MRSRMWYKVRFVYLAAFLMSFHYAFTIYINSTFLSEFFPAKTVGLLYTAGALLTVLILIASSSIIRRISNFYFFASILCTEIIVLLGLFSSSNPELIKILFVIHQAIPPLLLFGLDLFLEGTMRNENHTGGVHSLYLTAHNVAFVLSPLIVGKIVTMSSYRTIYLISAVFCMALLFLTFDEFRTIRTRKLREINFIDSLKKFVPHKNLNRIFIINFLLHSFYAAMVIYMPLYLHEVIGFSWEKIGFMFTIMLVPFVLFEAPLGRLFDRIGAEKDALIAGFFIISVSSCTIFFLRDANVLLWSALLFMSRVGASFVEVGAEYSFFKRVSDRDAGFISIFRMAGPMAYIVAPLLTSLLVRVLPIHYIFLVVSIAILSGIAFAYKLNTQRKSL